MTAAVITVAKPSDVADTVLGNKRVTFRDISANTGTYTTGGFTVTAAQLGLRHVDMCMVGSIATNGTSGATANAVGISGYGSGQTITFQVYESAATGLAQLEKTSDEAYAANWTFRVMAVGTK